MVPGTDEAIDGFIGLRIAAIHQTQNLDLSIQIAPRRQDEADQAQ